MELGFCSSDSRIRDEGNECLGETLTLRKVVTLGKQNVSTQSFHTVVLEKTLESTWDCKEIQPVHPKGDQSWVFTGRIDTEAETPVLWPPDGKRGLTGKDPDAGKDYGPEEMGMTEDEMVGWHH